MKNYEVNHYREKPVNDLHVHVHVSRPLADTVATYREIMEHMNYDRMAIQALPSHDVTDLYKALYCKAVIPGVYAFGGLYHHMDDRDTAENYRRQAEACYAMGCDGFKMLEGKPDYRKELGKPLDDPSLWEFYAFAEEKELPILMHLGDPREFWDRERIPQWALERGWLYDDSFVPFEQTVREVEGILEKFPRLHLTLAHFFFTSDDPDYAASFMERFPNACFDLTPGCEMYTNFSQNSGWWREFFLKYADRILYGTDIYNWTADGRTTENRYAHAVNLQRQFLERTEPFTAYWPRETFEHPFGLPEEVLDKIYYDNFIRLCGAKPRPIDPARIRQEARQFMATYELDDVQTANMNVILDYFK
ncbi:MAG: hypothetical protein E7541_03505 [Ruminococcaceae bacterium]|nr:hypothetical protein [Oscillospiraceae bacterium]